MLAPSRLAHSSVSEHDSGSRVLALLRSKASAASAASAAQNCVAVASFTPAHHPASESHSTTDSSSAAQSSSADSSSESDSSYSYSCCKTLSNSFANLLSLHFPPFWPPKGFLGLLCSAFTIGSKASSMPASRSNLWLAPSSSSCTASSSSSSGCRVADSGWSTAAGWSSVPTAVVRTSPTICAAAAAPTLRHGTSSSSHSDRSATIDASRDGPVCAAASSCNLASDASKSVQSAGESLRAAGHTSLPNCSPPSNSNQPITRAASSATVQLPRSWTLRLSDASMAVSSPSNPPSCFT